MKFTSITILFSTLFILSCDTPEGSFQIAKEAHTIESYEEFVLRYPDSELAADAKARIDQLVIEKKKEARALELAPFKNPFDLKNDFVLIKAGTFQMGSNFFEGALRFITYEHPVHQVTISKPFYLGKYEVTQSQWEAVMESNPSYFKGSSLPVEGVSWMAAKKFVKRLNELEGCTGCYRLPTEAEWEYAARAGTTTAFSFGDDSFWAPSYMWNVFNSDDTTHPVGEKRPNDWGLFDMHGNVEEWVQDKFEPYSSSARTDPTGSVSSIMRVLRGGSIQDAPDDTRSASRNTHISEHNDKFFCFGFRVVRIVP